MIELFTFQFSYSQLLFFMIVPLFVGMGKTGVHGIGLAAVPILAVAFGGRGSSGIMLPMLCMADVFAVVYYHRHANWSHLVRLFPWVALGVFAGTYAGVMINDAQFRHIMAFIIFGSLIVMIWRERSNSAKIPTSFWFAAILGLLGGFTTMVGNLAGTVMALYFLSMRLPKNEYIGTTAWFFLVVNFFKVPFHIFSWHTITLETFKLNLIALPIIAVGAYLGIVIVRHIPELYYRWFIIFTTTLAAVVMVL